MYSHRLYSMPLTFLINLLKYVYVSLNYFGLNFSLIKLL